MMALLPPEHVFIVQWAWRNYGANREFGDAEALALRLRELGVDVDAAMVEAALALASEPDVRIQRPGTEEFWRLEKTEGGWRWRVGNGGRTKAAAARSRWRGRRPRT